MDPDDRYQRKNNYLKRLAAEYYRGHAYVHWSMTLQARKTGWLTLAFHCKFREILTHTMFRYSLCCPIYCCMPNHIHLFWMGILAGSDQRNATRYFRKHFNEILKDAGFQFQKQPYDHVLREEERERNAFEDVAEYIARNPERAVLVKEGSFREYPYTGCLVPGYPGLTLWQDEFWDRFWKIYSRLRKHGLIQLISDR